MARTESNMLPLGTRAPEFKLRDVTTDNTFHLGELQGPRATLIMFICNHCPFVKHVNQGIVSLAGDYESKGVSFIAISSNDIQNYPEDSPENMKRVAREERYSFPYLFDETQEVARSYQAACTPDFYLFDSNLLLVYRGQLDDSRPQNGIPVTGNSLRAAMNAVLENRPVDSIQKPSLGCNIKWNS